MQITKQLALFLDNRPGTLARLADELAKAKLNIYAITTSDTVDHSVIRLVVDDYRRALHLFEEHGTLVGIRQLPRGFEQGLFPVLHVCLL